MKRGKDGKYHYLYIVSNSVNEKLYIGIHSTNKLQDGYKGSGSYLKKAFKKYGVDKFKKEIIEFFESRNTALAAEKVVVNEYYLLSKFHYNRQVGGKSGNYIGGHPLEGRSKTKEHIENIKKALKTRGGHSGKNNPMYGKTHSETTKLNYSQDRKGKNLGKDNSFYGKTHTEEFKKRISKIRKKYKGELCEFSKPILHLLTGVFYCSIKEAAEAHNIGYSTLRARLNKGQTKEFLKLHL